MAAEQRLEKTLAHVQASLKSGDVTKGADALEGVAKRLKEYAEGNAEAFAKTIKVLEDPLFDFKVEMSKEEHRARCLAQLKKLAEAGAIRLRDLKEDAVRYFTSYQPLVCYDLSLLIKSGVQYSLWGGSILNLGTAHHHKLYLEDIQTLRLPGCFAMTEIHHGSNVRGIETEAVYDRATEEFVVHTPHEGAMKWWIGNAAVDGLMATVFAQLKIDGKSEGVHAFVVPLRDPSTCRPLPGVTIGDCGPKVGLNGVDNGYIMFDHVRIPRTNLLDRFGSVSADGTYHTAIPDPDRRFAAVVGELTGGRVGLSSGSVQVLKMAVAIAVRYGARRRQFGPPNAAEITILDYQTQQEKLMPLVAHCYAYSFATRYLIQRYAKRTPKDANEVHSLSAGLKSMATWFTAHGLNVCREACGGHGYSAYNRIGQLRSDHDIFQTFEGDNTVLMQQVAKDILTQYKRQYANLTGPVRYMARQFQIALTEKNPITTGSTAETHLRDPRFQLAAFQYRTARLVHTAALRLRKQMSQGKDAFSAWNACLSHLLLTAQSYVEQIVLEQFIAAVAGAPSELQPLLKLTCDTYALSRIHADIGSFRNQEYVKGSKARGIRDLLTVLYAQMRKNATTLIDGFGIPDWLLQAPLGLANGDIYDVYLRTVKDGNKPTPQTTPGF